MKLTDEPRSAFGLRSPKTRTDMFGKPPDTVDKAQTTLRQKKNLLTSIDSLHDETLVSSRSSRS